MTLEELQKQARKLSIGDRWRLVKSVLTSIEQETQIFTVESGQAQAPELNSGERLTPSNSNTNSLAELAPWTQNLVGVIKTSVEEDLLSLM